MHWRPFAAPILRAFAWAFPVAFDEVDKDTDKARDKVDASPEGAGHSVMETGLSAG